MKSQQRSRYSLTIATCSSGPNKTPEELSLETTLEQLERCGRPHFLRQAVPNSWCDSSEGMVAPIVEVGCDGQQVQGRRRTKLPPWADRRRRLGDPSSIHLYSVPQSSCVRTTDTTSDSSTYGPRHWPSNAVNLTEDGDTSSCRSHAATSSLICACPTLMCAACVDGFASSRGVFT